MQLNKYETMHKICPLCSPYSLPFPFGSFQVNWLRCVRDALTHTHTSILFTTNFRDVEQEREREKS